jgi:hypothetical protein
MMTTSEKATQKAMTSPHLSVHHTSFLWALCHELVRSMTHRFVVPSGGGRVGLKRSSGHSLGACDATLGGLGRTAPVYLAFLIGGGGCNGFEFLRT